MGNNVETYFGIEIVPEWNSRATDYNPMEEVDTLTRVRGIIGKALRPTDQNPTHYLKAVRASLAQILQSRAGQALAKSLQFHSGKWPGSQKGKAIVVTPIEFDSWVAEETHLSQYGDRPVIGFSPETLERTRDAAKFAALTHEKLHHELVHALRDISGKLQRSLPAPWGNQEEFLAVLMTDIFISDATNHRKSGMRGSYNTQTALDNDLKGQYRFFRLGIEAFHVIERFCSQNPTYTAMISHVPAPFNPIADFYRNRQKAFDMAISGEEDSLISLDYYMKNGIWYRINDLHGVPPEGATYAHELGLDKPSKATARP